MNVGNCENQKFFFNFSAICLFQNVVKEKSELYGIWNHSVNLSFAITVPHFQPINESIACVRARIFETLPIDSCEGDYSTTNIAYTLCCAISPTNWPNCWQMWTILWEQNHEYQPIWEESHVFICSAVYAFSTCFVWVSISLFHLDWEMKQNENERDSYSFLRFAAKTSPSFINNRFDVENSKSLDKVWTTYNI